jgi:hypothetical protein
MSVVQDPLAAGLDRLQERADALADRLGPAARAATTVGIERATLRLLGIQGLDRAGAPLASAVVDRATGLDPARLARGVLLPFAAALVLYESTPQDIAIDVASGSIDLDLEAEALLDPDRARAARDEAGRLLAVALERIDANRTARHETLDLLGDAPRPWVGASLHSVYVHEACDEAAILVSGGADVVRVRVPASRELAERLHDLEIDPRDEDLVRFPGAARSPGEIPPAGSQRGLALLREVVDEAAAERRAYARIATATRALAAPEQAVVAAFERMDIIEADPIAEIVGVGVDPDRALADHSFARRLARRAGARVLLGPGPLVVAPDLATGRPAAPEVRAGRAIALQALGVSLARGDGLSDADLLLGALPAWLLDERDAATLAIVCVVLQHRLHPSVELVLDEPPRTTDAGSRWSQLLVPAALLARASGLVLRDVDGGSIASAVDGTRTAAETAAELGASLEPMALGAAGLDLAARTVDAAVATLVDLDARGWDAVVGPSFRDGIRDAPLAKGTRAPRGDGIDVAETIAGLIAPDLPRG